MVHRLKQLLQFTLLKELKMLDIVPANTLPFSMNHKITPALLALCLFFQAAQAQAGTDELKRSVYVFDRFTNGSVRLKSGALEQAPLNYNAEKQGIAFLKEGQYYDLVGLETVDTVYLNDKKFVPVEGHFYELIQAQPFELYATYTCKAQPVTATTEHNGSLRKDANQISNTVSDVYVTRQYRGDYAMEFRKHYWVKRYRNFYKVDTEKQIMKLYPKKEAQIRNYIKEQQINFNDQNDVVKLLRFCSEQTQ